MTDLLDANVLIAIAVADHVHHEVAERWFVGHDSAFATCPITQGALLRLVVRHGATADQALAVLTSVTSHRRHQFWPDDLGFGEVPLAGVIGHRQVTDAYLAASTRQRRSRLATFDRGLVALHADVAFLVRAEPSESETLD